ncbi:hypothetical protein MYXO_03870 [Myxococcaceae bacterium]|nr:hypothetical protein MYXO_03870 [Myxococcaceae bacterium]
MQGAATARVERGWLDERSRLEALARAIEPSVRIETKDGWIWRALGRLAAIATFGGISKRRFLEDFATTLGPLQGYPAAWSAGRVEMILVHEARHTYQARLCGFGLHPWLGIPIFAVLYLALPVPLGFAWLRLLFELDADRAAWRHALARGASPHEIRARARAFAAVVCSGSYGWAMPRGIGERVFERAAERVITEFESDPDASARA